MDARRRAEEAERERLRRLQKEEERRARAEAARLHRAEAERLAALAAARLTQPPIEEEGIERERLAQEIALRKLRREARRERRRAERERREREAAERAATRKRRRRPVISQPDFWETEFAVAGPEQPFSDDELARERSAAQQQSARVRESEELLARLREQQRIGERERERLIARIAEVSLVPLMIRTNPDQTILVTDPASQADVLAEAAKLVGMERAPTDESGCQTELASDGINAMVALREKRGSEVERGRALKAEMAVETERIAEIENHVHEIEADIAKQEKDILTVNSEISKLQEQEEIRSAMRVKRLDDVKKQELIRAAIRQKRIDMQRVIVKSKTLEERLAELQKLRDALDLDLKDMAHREKPEVRRLAKTVIRTESKIGQSSDQLLNAKEQLQEKRKQLEKAHNAEGASQVRDLIVERCKLERRQAKWRLLLKTSKEAIHTLEFFSAAHSQRRHALSKALQRVEGEGVQCAQNYNELEWYSDLLAGLIAEHLSNWRNG
jgi:hypothetical protein